MAELLAANQITIAKVLDGEKGEMSPEQVAQLNKASQDASVAVSKVDNLEIGGRNLLTNPIYLAKDGLVSNGITFNRTSNPSVLKLKGTATARYNVSLIGFTDTTNPTKSTILLKEGQTYTVSIKIEGSWADGAYIAAGISNSSGNWLSNFTFTTNKSYTFTATATQYALRYWTVVIPSGGVVDCTIYCKFEIGDKATDWTPAPEDVDAGIDNAAKVATNFLGYDSTNGLIIGNKASGAWSGYRSQILPDSFNILDESSTVLASFGTTTVIGEEAKANMHLTFNNLSMVDANGTEFFKVGDTRNADGIATLKSIATPYIDSTGSVTLTFESSISSVISVYVNSVELSSSNYSVSGKRITFRNLTPNSRPTIETTFTTTEPSFYLTFGNRLSSGKTGKYSVAEGKDVIASGFASRAEGVNTEASGEYSHAGGYHTKASGDCSYAGGYWTVADGDYVTAIGRYNRKYTGINDKVFVIGNGSSDTNRSNALAVDWNGNLTLGTPLSVENGGTGATTAAAARANLEIYQRELVWDNANDTQKFAAQTIALDLSSYDYAEVHFFVSSTYDERVVGIGIIHERASHIYAQVMSNVDTSDTPIYVTQRVADVSANGVTFSDAYTKFITSTSTQQNNNRMVPTKIYAFKALEA